MRQTLRNAAAILTAIGGKKGSELIYDAPLTTAECSEPIAIVVPLKKNGKKGKRVIKLDAISGSGAKDRNVLKLTCLP